MYVRATEPVYTYTNYDHIRDLQNNYITSMVQDEEGLIWFSSWNGLFSFNGYTFQRYDLVSDKGQLIGNNRINQIVLSSAGGLYCISQDKNIYLFDRKEKSFTNLSAFAGLPDHFAAISFYPLSKGVTWVEARNNYCIRIDERVPLSADGMVSYTQLLNIGNNRVNGILEDSQGGEWVLTTHGTFLFDSDTIFLNEPFRYAEEMDGSVWLATPSGEISHFDLKGRTCEQVSIGKTPEKITMFKKQNDSILLIGTSDALLSYNPTGEVTVLAYLSNDKGIGVAYSTYSDSSGNLWVIGERPGILRINSAGASHYYPPLPLNEVEVDSKGNRPMVREDLSGRVWIIPRNGSLCYYDSDEDCLRYLRQNGSVVSPPCRHSFSDNQNNLWICSSKSLGKLSLYQTQYDILPIDETEFGIRSLMTDHEGNLWAASKKGYIHLFDRELNPVGYLNRKGEIVSTPTVFEENIYAMLEDSRHRIWIASKGGGLFLIRDRHVEHFLHDDRVAYSLSHDYAVSLLEDSRHRIWVGCHSSKGLNLVQTDEHGNIQFINGYNRMGNYPDYHGELVRCIAETPDSIILVGSTTGLVAFRSNFQMIEQVNFQTYFHEIDSLASLSDNDIMDFCTDREGNIWLGTHFGGLTRVIDKREILTGDASFTQSSVAVRQALGQVNSMISDTLGRIWTVSNSFFSCFDPSSGHYDFYESASFVPEHVLFLDNASITLPDGRIAIGSEQGVFLFNPYTIQKSLSAPALSCEGVWLSDGTLLPRQESEIVLTPSQRDVRFRYAALEYHSPGQIRYSYRMLGLEEEWNDVQESRTASYFNLPSGHYVFQVRSTNHDGVACDNILEIPIFRQPTFWESGWRYPAFILIVLCTAGLLVGIPLTIVRLRRKIAQEAAEREKLQAYCLALLAEKKEAETKEVPEKDGEDKPYLAEKDRLFMEQIRSFILENIENSELVIDNLADSLGMSRTVMYKRTKLLFGMSPVMLVRHIRILHAATLIDEGSLNVTEIAYQCGFSNPNYFSTCFKEQLGMTPSEYKSRSQKTNF